VRFATRLALFLAVTLVVIQVATGLAIYSSIRGTLVDEGKMRLTTARDQLIRQLEESEAQVADGVKVLTLPGFPNKPPSALEGGRIFG
jgi:hypothetical protein